METFNPATHEEWLEFRRARLTSTELADLHLHKTRSRWQEVRDGKEYGPSFHGNRFTQWGLAREPLLAPHVVVVDTRLVYNEDPQTIVINPDDGRLCGTPDLLSEDGQVIGEIKTAKHRFTGGRYHHWCPDRYYLQVQANMEHTQAEACVLLVEYYTERDGEFTPEWFEKDIILPDLATVAELKATAAQWFAWLDGTPPDWWGEELGLDNLDELTELVESLAAAEAETKRWGEEAKQLKARVIELTGGAYAGSVAGHKLTVSTTGDSTVFDAAGFRRQHPDMARQFTKTRAGYTTVRLTKDTK